MTGHTDDARALATDTFEKAALLIERAAKLKDGQSQRSLIWLVVTIGFSASVLLIDSFGLLRSWFSADLVVLSKFGASALLVIALGGLATLIVRERALLNYYELIHDHNQGPTSFLRAQEYAGIDEITDFLEAPPSDADADSVMEEEVFELVKVVADGSQDEAELKAKLEREMHARKTREKLLHSASLLIEHNKEMFSYGRTALAAKSANAKVA
jgi:hypothetical protein